MEPIGVEFNCFVRFFQNNRYKQKTIYSLEISVLTEDNKWKPLPYQDGNGFSRLLTDFIHLM